MAAFPTVFLPVPKAGSFYSALGEFFVRFSTQQIEPLMKPYQILQTSKIETGLIGLAEAIIQMDTKLYVECLANGWTFVQYR